VPKRDWEEEKKKERHREREREREREAPPTDDIQCIDRYKAWFVR
jgi:hypothetical protein